MNLRAKNGNVSLMYLPIRIKIETDDLEQEYINIYLII